MSNENHDASSETPALPDDLLKTGPDANSELSESDLEGVSGGKGAVPNAESWKFQK